MCPCPTLVIHKNRGFVHNAQHNREGHISTTISRRRYARLSAPGASSAAGSWRWSATTCSNPTSPASVRDTTKGAWKAAARPSGLRISPRFRRARTWRRSRANCWRIWTRPSPHGAMRRGSLPVNCGRKNVRSCWRFRRPLSRCARRSRSRSARARDPARRRLVLGAVALGAP